MRLIGLSAGDGFMDGFSCVYMYGIIFYMGLVYA